jgi:hypothetical protein
MTFKLRGDPIWQPVPAIKWAGRSEWDEKHAGTWTWPENTMCAPAQRVMKGYNTNAAPPPICVFPQEGAYAFYLRYVDFSVRQAVCPSPSAIAI